VKSVALAVLAEPSFHMTYFLSLTQVLVPAGLVKPVRVPRLRATVVNTGVVKTMPIQEVQT